MPKSMNSIIESEKETSKNAKKVIITKLSHDIVIKYSSFTTTDYITDKISDSLNNQVVLFSDLRFNVSDNSDYILINNEQVPDIYRINFDLSRQQLLNNPINIFLTDNELLNYEIQDRTKSVLDIIKDKLPDNYHVILET